MDDIPGIPRIAHLLADPARATMLWALIDGTMRPAGELAYAANISAQSASAHLAKLVEGGFLASEAQRSEERRVGKSVDLGGGRISNKKRRTQVPSAPVASNRRSRTHE